MQQPGIKEHLAITNSEPPVNTYVVSDPDTFPALRKPPKWDVFINGLYATPNVDYTVLGATLKITATLNAGDRVSVVDRS